MAEPGVEGQQTPTVLVPPDFSQTAALVPATMTIEQAILAFLQEEHTHDWEPKTRKWHETALAQLQRYLAWREVILLYSLTGSELREWLTFLRTESLATGAFRAQSTISTYARSVHAFCTWLVRKGYMEQTPFAHVKVPKRRSGVCASLSRRPLSACFMPAMQRERNEQ
jgi:site-specific recombinase XerD